ncbi:hypothetical protein [Micromonospora sp. NPDC047738]|uniref:hypothetical protein n=1 Tax=unclassified Micromonospora TaxID=2617518 RepID=UPI0033F92BC2
MASAHVAGCIAVVAEANPLWTVGQAANHVLATATTGLVTSPGAGSPNRLLYCAP